MKEVNGVYGGTGQFYKKYAILDEYNYSFFRETDLVLGTDVITVSIKVRNIRDATISDILSEIADCENFIYVEGQKYIFQASVIEEDTWLVLVLKPEGETDK